MTWTRSRGTKWPIHRNTTTTKKMKAITMKTRKKPRSNMTTNIFVKKEKLSDFVVTNCNRGLFAVTKQKTGQFQTQTTATKEIKKDWSQLGNPNGVSCSKNIKM